MTDNWMFWFALYVVLHSEVLDELEPRMITLSPDGRSLGRPAYGLPVLAVLVGAILACDRTGSGPGTEGIRRELEALDPEAQHLLGIRAPNQLAYHAVDHTLNRMFEVLNPADRVAGKATRVASANFKRRLHQRCEKHAPIFRPDCPACNAARAEALRREGCPEHKDQSDPDCERCQTAASPASLRPSSRGEPRAKTAGELAAAQHLLDQVGDMLLQAGIPADLPVQAVAVDWTDYESWASPPDANGGISAAPLAGKGRRKRKPTHGPFRPKQSRRSSRPPSGGNEDDVRVRPPKTRKRRRLEPDGPNRREL